MTRKVAAPTIHDEQGRQSYLNELYRRQELTLLATLEATSSATLEFSDGIDGRFRTYLFDINIIPTNDDVGLSVRLSTDNGTTWVSTGSLYSWVAYGRTGDSTIQSNRVSTNSLDVIPGADLGGSRSVGNGATEGCKFDLEMTYADDSTRFTEVRALSAGWINAVAKIALESFQGVYTSTDIVNGVQFYMEAGSISTGTIKMYGKTDRP